MRAQPNHFQARCIRQAIDQYKVWLDVAVAMILPLSTQVGNRGTAQGVMNPGSKATKQM